MAKICYLADADSSHTRKWVDYFSDLGDEIHLISMRDTKYKYKDNVKLYVIKPPFKSKLSYFFIINSIKKLINKINPDLIHSHYATSYGLYGRLSKKHPLIISVWGSDVYDFPKSSKLKEKLFIYILKGADVICSTSEDMALEIKKYYDKKNIEITPFGVDIERFNIINKPLSNNYITIGVVKNLRKVYGIEYLIKAFVDLSKEIEKDIRLMIVGDGEERENLENLSKKLNIENKVNFVGNIDNKEVSKYINKMDIICMPSIRESFGVAAVEAEACGRPVVCSDVGGLKEVVLHNKTGYLFKSEDIEDLKEKLKKLILDEKKIMEFSTKGREFVVEKYDWNKNAALMKKIYNSVLNKK